MKRQVEQNGQAVDMKEREHRQNTIGFSQVDVCAALLDVRNKITVREHDALGVTRRSG